METLKSELNKAQHYDLKLMSEDYLTVNKVLEDITYQKYSNPKSVVKAPKKNQREKIRIFYFFNSTLW